MYHVNSIAQSLEDWKNKLELETSSVPFPKKEIRKLLSQTPFEKWPPRPYWGLLLRVVKEDHLHWLQGLDNLGLPLDPRVLELSYECAWFSALQCASVPTTLRWLLNPENPKANINAPEGALQNGQSALMYTCQYSHFSLEMVEFLLKAGANPNYESKQGETLLLKIDDEFNPHSYNSREDYCLLFDKALHALFEHGLDIHQPLSSGKTTFESLSNDVFKTRVEQAESLYLQQAFNQSLPTSQGVSKSQIRL